MARYDDIRELEPNLTGHGLRVGVVRAASTRTSARACARAAWPNWRTSAWPMPTSPSPPCPARWNCRWRCRRWRRAAASTRWWRWAAVIRGETYHFEVVSNESARGITDVQLNTGIPIANARADHRERRPGAGAHGAEGCRGGAGGHRDGQPAESAEVVAGSESPAGRPKAMHVSHGAGAAREPASPPSSGRGRAGRSSNPRRRAREFVIQGLYQWQVGDQDEAAIQVQAEGVAGFDKADRPLYATLLGETRQQAEALKLELAPAYRPRLGRGLADRALHPAAGRLRTQAPPRNALPRDHQRSHRTGQDLWRHRRPQVRQWRARQAGRGAACRKSKT